MNLSSGDDCNGAGISSDSELRAATPPEVLNRGLRKSRSSSPTSLFALTPRGRLRRKGRKRGPKVGIRRHHADPEEPTKPRMGAFSPGVSIDVVAAKANPIRRGVRASLLDRLTTMSSGSVPVSKLGGSPFSHSSYLPTILRVMPPPFVLDDSSCTQEETETDDCDWVIGTGSSKPHLEFSVANFRNKDALQEPLDRCKPPSQPEHLERLKRNTDCGAVWVKSPSSKRPHLELNFSAADKEDKPGKKH